MKRITAIILTLAMLCAVSCNGGTNALANTAAETITTDTTVGTDILYVPEETTVTEETTAADETDPALPEFDINSEECLMYRLLDMTVDEIEAEFAYGENLRYGGNRRQR